MARRSLTLEIDKIRNKLNSHAIVLVGLMGAGKSTVGRRLAERLDVRFVDADLEIEKAAGKTIPEIFHDHGEAYFRDGERKVIARLLANGPQVMATGGGAFMSEETRRNIEASGVSVWLRADLPLLLKRVRKRSNRPLLKDGDPEDVMRKLIEARYPVYALADITIESRDVAHTAMVSEVLRALADWPGWEKFETERIEQVAT